MLRSLRWRVGGALRYKLLALVLLPLLLALASTLGYALYRLNAFAIGSLYSAARSDLAVARAALRQIQEDQLAELQKLAATPGFRASLHRSDAPAIQMALRRVRDANGFAFLHLTGVAGNWLHEPDGAGSGSSKPSPLTDRAARGLAGAALELFRANDLEREAPALVDRLRAAPEASVRGEAALVLRAVQPIADPQGRVTAVLDAGVLVDHNSAVLESMLARIFTADSPRSGAKPIVSLLLDGQRVDIAPRSEQFTASVPGNVLAGVVESGNTWVGRDRFAGQSIISAYGPLFDVHGQRIGVLHVGFNEAAFSGPHYRAVGGLAGFFVVVMALVAWITIRGLGKQLRPLETMAGVVRATQAGENRRIGPIGSRDEVADLARQFDTMLDLLESRNREIQQVANGLEVKVTERTRELVEKNVELESSLRQLEEMRAQLVHAEKLSALGQMAAGIAHELNNPAAVILGNIQLLEAELGDSAKPVIAEIRHISQQVERIRHIVTSLLQFASPAPATGKASAVDLNAVVIDVLPLVKDVIQQKQINLERKLEARRMASANVFDLEQVLINLIVNAANAVAPGGRIEIETADAADGGVEARVRDNGRGIPPGEQARIFDPFFTTDPRRGAGLGLSVSYGLAQRHGGRISLRSEPGLGSEFCVWLPGSPAAAQDLEETATPPGDRQHVNANPGRGKPQSGSSQIPEEGRHTVTTADRGGGTRGGAGRRAARGGTRARAHDARNRRTRTEPRD